MSGLGYVSQLRHRWGVRAPRQLYRMWKLHRTPFEEILGNIFEALDDTGSRFAFPTVAAVAKMRPDLIRYIMKEGHEVASHGFNHVRYPTLSASARERDLLLSLQTLKKMGVSVSGFRAPYDRYTDDMPALIEAKRLLWDGGFGYREEHRSKTHFFQVRTGLHEPRTYFIPLNVMSDDLMIDGKGWGPSEVANALKREIRSGHSSKGVVMFDLHPIRMGQAEFSVCLREVSEFASRLGAWMPTPAEAVTYWKKHRRWKSDHDFCVLLTGDIDNWVFSDYLRRMIWRQA